MLATFTKSALGLLLASQMTSMVNAGPANNAELAYTVLQKWYNTNNGLWVPSTGWWNSANCLTTVAQLALIDSAVKSNAASVYPQTLKKAAAYNTGTTARKSINSKTFETHSTYTASSPSRVRARGKADFLNDFYDDEGWWALAWIAVYDVTRNNTYLSVAEDIFADLANAYGTTPCNGGIWWSKERNYVNAIANELFIHTAASLANRVNSGSQKSKSYYLDYAQRSWQWFSNSGMINSQNLINDGLDSNCKNNNGVAWSYNQGVILGGLAELAAATGNSGYITRAQQIADAAISALTRNGILHDICEPDCGNDGTQFKGVFARGIRRLYQAQPQSRYATFLTQNANSIWSNDRSTYNVLSTVWSGPFQAPGNASTQSSALDALVGALAVSQ